MRAKISCFTIYERNPTDWLPLVPRSWCAVRVPQERGYEHSRHLSLLYSHTQAVMRCVCHIAHHGCELVIRHSDDLISSVELCHICAERILHLSN